MGGRPPADPKVPPCSILGYPFLAEGPQFFLKAPLAPIYITLRRKRAPKKLTFLVNIFQKVPKNSFFSKFCWCRNFGQNRVFLVLWENSENQFGRPRKKVEKIFESFLKIRPPRENPRSASLMEIVGQAFFNNLKSWFY